MNDYSLKGEMAAIASVNLDLFGRWMSEDTLNILDVEDQLVAEGRNCLMICSDVDGVTVPSLDVRFGVDAGELPEWFEDQGIGLTLIKAVDGHVLHTFEMTDAQTVAFKLRWHP